MNQKEGVTNAVMSVLNEKGVDYEMGGEVILKDILTAEDLKSIRAIVINGLKSGLIDITPQAETKHTSDGFKKYTNGLVNNWIRKNKDFNNGVTYQIKNPGSKAGSGDEQVRELKKLLKLITDPIQSAKVQAALTKRLAEIKPESVITINVDALPESLRHLVS